jgi:hypothetical protein
VSKKESTKKKGKRIVVFVCGELTGSFQCDVELQFQSLAFFLRNQENVVEQQHQVVLFFFQRSFLHEMSMRFAQILKKEKKKSGAGHQMQKKKKRSKLTSIFGWRRL